jgi:long-chain acyl-CoA synthetase
MTSKHISRTLVHRFWSNALANPQDIGPVVRILPAVIEAGQATHVFYNQHQSMIAVAALMSALRKRGIVKGDRVAIIGENRPEWVWADLAIQSLGAIAVSIYSNDSDKQVNFVLKDSGAKLLISTDADQLAKGNDVEKMQVDLIGMGTGFRVGSSFFDRVGRGSVEPEFAGYEAELDMIRKTINDEDFLGIVDPVNELATLVYTSGSSGTPKGCMITHDNIVASITSVIEFGVTQDKKKDRTVSYLPLGHIFGRINGTYMGIWDSIPTVFSPGQASAKELAEHMGANCKAFSPTMLCGVPALWQKIADAIYSPKEGPGKVLAYLGIWKHIVNAAVASDPNSIAGRFFDKLIFNKVSAKLGGKLGLLVSGGAAISVDLLKLYHRMGLELLEGYGATETTSGIITNLPSWAAGNGPKNRPGSAGRLVPGMEWKLTPVEGEDPTVGELWLRGRQIIKGYWNLPEKTAESFTADGWYRTNDLARRDEDGFFDILGRADGMMKNEGGKFVSRERIEKAFQTFPVVHYTVPVAQKRKYTSALIFVNHDVAKTLAGDVPAGQDAGKFYAEHPAVLAAVNEAVKGANATLEHWEQVSRYKVMPMAATIDGGIITPTQKIRSKELTKRFADIIDAIYAGTDGINTKDR